MERGVVDPKAGKLERFERIVIESARQCGRAWVMEIAPPVEFEKLVVEAEHDVRLIAEAPGGDVTACKQAVPHTGKQAVPHTANVLKHTLTERRVMVLVGPEGGWSDKEKQMARDAGFKCWRFGPYAMRVETAAIVGVAILRSGA